MALVHGPPLILISTTVMMPSLSAAVPVISIVPLMVVPSGGYVILIVGGWLDGVTVIVVVLEVAVPLLSVTVSFAV